MRRVLMCAVLSSLVGGCGGGEKSDDAGTEPGAQVDPTTAEAPEPPPAADEEPAYVLATTSLKKVPSDDKRVDDPEGKAKDKVSNWAGTLYRGEKVTVLESDDGWSKVRISSDDEGWLKTDKLVRTADVSIATLLEDAKTFKRPDLMTQQSKRTVGAGALVFVMKNKEQFSQLNYPRSEYSAGEAWVLTEKLNTSDDEIEAAKVLTRIRQLRAKKDELALELETVAKAELGSSAVLALLEADKAAEAAAAEAAGSEDKPAE